MDEGCALVCLALVEKSAPTMTSSYPVRVHIACGGHRPAETRPFLVGLDAPVRLGVGPGADRAVLSPEAEPCRQRPRPPGLTVAVPGRADDERQQLPLLEITGRGHRPAETGAFPVGFDAPVRLRGRSDGADGRVPRPEAEPMVDKRPCPPCCGPASGSRPGCRRSHPC